MRRIGMTVWMALGGVWLTAGTAAACEHPAARSETPAPAKAPAADDADAKAAPAREDAAGEVHAARCQCGSAADCTCKKGTCECPRCKKPRAEPGSPGEARLPARHEAPRDGLRA